MKTLTEYLWFETKERRDLVNITGQIETLVERSGVREGLCLVSAMHITAAIWVNDNEPGLWQDLCELLERLAPFGPVPFGPVPPPPPVLPLLDGQFAAGGISAPSLAPPSPQSTD